MHTHDEYRQAATVLWGEAGTFAVDEFQRLNVWLFAATLPPLPIVIGLTAYGGCIGLTRSKGTWAAERLPRITLASTLFQDGRQWVTDTLIHEMVHAKLMLGGLDPQHNGKPWCAEIVRLSPLVCGRTVAARPVYPRRVGGRNGRVVRQAHAGELTREELAHWPRSLYSRGWKPGKPIAVPTY